MSRRQSMLIAVLGPVLMIVGLLATAVAGAAVFGRSGGATAIELVDSGVSDG